MVLPLPGDVFLLIGSFAATAALVYGAPQAPLSQPRNVVGGHIIGAFIGVAVCVACTTRILGDGALIPPLPAAYTGTGTLSAYFSG